jgi:hemoglobin-like flavoprotein
MDLQSLETSFDLVAPRGDDLVDTFYARLFAAEPDVRPLFDGTDSSGSSGAGTGNTAPTPSTTRSSARC